MWAFIRFSELDLVYSGFAMESHACSPLTFCLLHGNSWYAYVELKRLKVLGKTCLKSSRILLPNPFSRILPTNPLINLPHRQLFLANSSTRSLRSIVHWIASIRDYIKGVFLASHVVTGGVTEVWESEMETSKLLPRSLVVPSAPRHRQEDPATWDLFDELFANIQATRNKPQATSRK